MQAFFQASKPVAAICHAVQVLASAGVLKGRRATCYHLVRSELIGAGGDYVDREVVVDENLVTSRVWPDHPAFIREFMRLLKGVEQQHEVSIAR